MHDNISSQQFKQSLGEYLSAVRFRGDRLIIEQRGVQVAAVVPIHVLEAYEKNREQLAQLMETVSARNADRDPEELDTLIEEEIAASRAERRARKVSGSKGT